MTRTSVSKLIASCAVALVCAMCAPAVAFAETDGQQSESGTDNKELVFGQGDGTEGNVGAGAQGNQQGAPSAGQQSSIGGGETAGAPAGNAGESDTTPTAGAQVAAPTTGGTGDLSSGTSVEQQETIVEQKATTADAANTANTSSASNTKGTTQNAPSATVSLTVQAHVQSKGWMKKKTAKSTGNVITVGTSGKGLRMEALRITFSVKGASGTIKAVAHVQKLGDRNAKWVDGKLLLGTTGKGYRMEAIKIWLEGDVADLYDIVYRAHVQKIGWQPWTVNGGMAGTSGRALRVEGIQIKLVKKDAAAPKSGPQFITLSDNPMYALANTTTGNVQASRTKFADTFAQRYYLWTNGAYVLLQSVSSGKFLTYKDGKVLQMKEKEGDASQQWAISGMDGGYTFMNLASNLYLALKSKLTVASDKGAKWMLTSAAILPNGYYKLKNMAQGKYLDVKDSSYATGARAIVNDKSGKTSQTFTFTRKSGNTYRVLSTQSLKAIEAAAKTTGAKVRQGDAGNSKKAQQWTVTFLRDGSFQLKNVWSGKVLTAKGSGASKANVASSTNASTEKQKWDFVVSKKRTNPGYERAYNHIRNRYSKTKYIFALDNKNNWLWIFKGKQGAWSLDRNWIVSTGKSTNRTPRGEFEIHGHWASDGDGNYNVWYYTMFRWTNAFHSIKYAPGSYTRIVDGRLGKHVSMGCVRMVLENAKWIYYNAPIGTHVSSYW